MDDQGQAVNDFDVVSQTGVDWKARHNFMPGIRTWTIGEAQHAVELANLTPARTNRLETAASLDGAWSLVTNVVSTGSVANLVLPTEPLDPGFYRVRLDE